MFRSSVMLVLTLAIPPPTLRFQARPRLTLVPLKSLKNMPFPYPAALLHVPAQIHITDAVHQCLPDVNRQK